MTCTVVRTDRLISPASYIDTKKDWEEFQRDFLAYSLLLATFASFRYYLFDRLTYRRTHPLIEMRPRGLNNTTVLLLYETIKMQPRISLRGCVRPSVGMSVALISNKAKVAEIEK